MAGLLERARNRIAPRRSLTAAARRINLGERSEASRLRAGQVQWQQDAWAYREVIGEVRTGVGFLRNAARRVQLIPGWLPADGGQPIPLEQALDDTAEPLANQRALDSARDVLSRLSGDTGSHGDLLEPFAENLEVPGEGYLVGYLEDPTDAATERWEFRSLDEVKTDAAGTVRLVDDEFEGMGGGVYGRELNLDESWLIRVWQPHPRYRAQADSPMRALLNPCEELLLVERTIRAASRSRMASAGLVLLPQETKVQGSTPDEDGKEPTLLDLITEAAVESIKNEGDARAVVPMFAEVPADSLDKIKHITFDRPLDDKLLDRLDKAIRRLAQGLDVPPEIVLGLADVNHWTAWQIDEGAFKNHVAPLFERMVDGITAGVYRPLLSDFYNLPLETVRRMVVWYDAGAITSKPNRTQDAKDAHGSLAISDEAFRRELQFDETDAPDELELARRIAQARGSIDPTMMDWMVKAYLDQAYPGYRTTPPGQISVGAGETAQEAEAANPPASAPAPPVVPGQVVPPPAETPPPDQQPPPETPPAEGPPPPAAVAAAATPTTTTARRFVQIERSLRDRLQAAADESVFRALERAGNRLRSKARANPALRAELEGVPAQLVGHKLGQYRARTLATEAEVVDAAFARLQEQYGSWTRSSAREALREAARIAGRELTDEQLDVGVAKLDADITAGWSFLQAGLAAATTRALFDVLPDDGPGEGRMSHYVDPSLVRGSLSIAGGMPQTSSGVTLEGVAVEAGAPVVGLTQGEWLSEFMVASGVATRGYEWVYGISLRHFAPHLALDGVIFGDYGDALLDNPLGWPASTCAPGDHKGCHCDAAPIFEGGVSTAANQAEIADATADPSKLQLLRDVAVQDEAAGRYGWEITTPIATVAEADRVANRRPSERE